MNKHISILIVVLLTPTIIFGDSFSTSLIKRSFSLAEFTAKFLPPNNTDVSPKTVSELLSPPQVNYEASSSTSKSTHPISNVTASVIEDNELVAEGSKRVERRHELTGKQLDKVPIDKGVEFGELTKFLKKHEDQFFTPDAANRRYRVSIRDKEEQDRRNKVYSKFGIKIRMVDPEPESKGISENNKDFRKQWGHWTDFETKRVIDPVPKVEKVLPTPTPPTFHNIKRHPEYPNRQKIKKPVKINDKKGTHNQHQHENVPTLNKGSVELGQSRNVKDDHTDRGEKSLLILTLTGKNQKIPAEPNNTTNTTKALKLDNNQEAGVSGAKNNSKGIRKVKVKRRKTGEKSMSKGSRAESIGEEVQEAKTALYRHPDVPDIAEEEELDGGETSVSKKLKPFKDFHSHEDGPLFLKHGKIDIAKIDLNKESVVELTGKSTGAAKISRKRKSQKREPTNQQNPTNKGKPNKKSTLNSNLKTENHSPRPQDKSLEHATSANSQEHSALEKNFNNGDAAVIVIKSQPRQKSSRKSKKARLALAGENASQKNPSTELKRGQDQNVKPSPEMYITADGKEIPLSALDWKASGAVSPENRFVDMSVGMESSPKLPLTPADVAWVNYGIP